MEVEPLFAVGQAVTARTSAPVSHTREPRYVRGRTGIIERDHGVFIFPDSHAGSGDPDPQHVYAVRFEGEELWGPGAQCSAVFVDLWDSYLQAAS